jgi:hypothetical protein
MIRTVNGNELGYQMEIIIETDPAVVAAAQAQMERHERNIKWMEAHAKEVFSHRGKVICIAGQELFVGDTVEDVVARATAAHPEDNGRFTHYIPESRLPRIYAHRWSMAGL